MQDDADAELDADGPGYESDFILSDEEEVDEGGVDENEDLMGEADALGFAAF